MAEGVTSLRYQPLISIIMPVYNTPEQFLREAIDSVLRQIYPHWELCIADDASSQAHVRSILQSYAAQDPRIKLVFRAKNGHISAASNSAIELATGAFIALLDHDDVMRPEALYEVVSLLNQHPEADMIYSDEDKLNSQGDRVEPFFKPDWCPDSFLSRMYTCHLGVYRRQLIDRLGGFRVGYEGSQDHDLVLRLTEFTDRVFHIPKVLYHWRIHAASTASSFNAKSYVVDAAKRAIADAVERRGEKVKAIDSNDNFPGIYIVRYQITDYKRVSIIIPTHNLSQILEACLRSIFDKTTYPNYEVILIDNGSDEIETLQVIQNWQTIEPKRFRCYPFNIPFNYAKLNNFAVTQAQGDYLLFLNNDVAVITSDWLEAMVEQVQRKAIGAVGSLLLYPDDTVQHAGVILGVGGVANHSHRHFPIGHPGYVGQLAAINNYSAITGACLMCRREVFEQVGGFDEHFAVAYNDVDLCLKMKQHGYHNVYLPHVMLYHHESKSRGYEDTPEKQHRFGQEVDRLQQKWGTLLEHDPCYNLNLSREKGDYCLAIDHP
ncbi:MAG: glycosyltransferase family 2 protein [Cyanobacteria bacterium RU_5_0]|nr:glycosyltransferase family 2 protein [Cyanobacteria bacterium RU_5_0]